MTHDKTLSKEIEDKRSSVEQPLVTFLTAQNHTPLSGYTKYIYYKHKLKKATFTSNMCCINFKTTD